MPTYEYRCGACGARFERFQKMTAEPVSVCPECGEEEVERLISSGGGLVFKGSGFYATDYRDPPKKSTGEGEGASGGKGESPDGGAGGSSDAGGGAGGDAGAEGGGPDD